jgi:hypothetical protein
MPFNFLIAKKMLKVTCKIVTDNLSKLQSFLTELNTMVIPRDVEFEEDSGCFGDMLHAIPWQTDHLFCWQRIAAHALAA